MNFQISGQTRQVPSKAGHKALPVPLHRANRGSYQESKSDKENQRQALGISPMNPSQIGSAEGDGNFLCPNVTARSSLSSNPNNGRVAGAAEVSREGKGHQDTDVSKPARSPRNSALGNNAWVLLGFFLTGSPSRQQQTGFKIYYIFLLPSVQTMKCVGDTTLRENYNLREGKAVKI